ncbi:histidinol phosphatase [Anaerosporomusa subterranea]|uniref:Histidinol phosphatase n=1 Tax=Anaerosporomusa subterranea TaxID=1794912 RepID=A0A154BR37_ANASB|nr:PHP domain-containing protein [Anaerosporomusa subterranea]KYZ75988.1 histidinol phosphatase [Anaerosporomusa subterranea]
MIVDLHIHTTASDGSWTPAELIEQVRLAGIGLFAVTDHDSVGSLAATARLAREAGLSFIPGVEICSTVRDRNFHILGYGIDHQSKPLEGLLRHNTELMEQADEDSIHKLIAQGLPINYAEYHDYRHNPARGGWKSLSYLTDKGLCADVKEFFSKLFTAERGIVFPTFPSPQAVIATIHAAGGKAVLAHPGSDFHGTMLEETLDSFAEEAIDGVECFHPSQDDATSLRALRWCERHGLLITGGSDCHGVFVPERRLGRPVLHMERLKLESLLV